MPTRAYRFVRLMSPDNLNTPAIDPDPQSHRSELLCQTYGLGLDVQTIIELVDANLGESVDFTKGRAAGGDEVQRRVLERGDVRTYQRDRAYERSAFEAAGQIRGRTIAMENAVLPGGRKDFLLPELLDMTSLVEAAS